MLILEVLMILDLLITDLLLVAMTKQLRFGKWLLALSCLLPLKVMRHMFTLCVLMFGITFIFSLISTSLDGKIKAWLYEQPPMAKFTFDAPGRQCITMAYSADGTRLFSYGTNQHGEKYLVEWEWEDGQRMVKRTYQGLHKQYGGNVHFDMNKNQILAAGDQYHIKFWDMDNASLLDICNAKGGLPVAYSTFCPCKCCVCS